MTTSKTLLNVDAVLDELRVLWRGPQPRDFIGRPMRSIAGSDQDQHTPEGVANPFWEIVRLLPASADFGKLTPLWDGSSVGITRDGITRDGLCRTFAWAIPSPGDVTWLADMTDGRGVVEVGAGAGYWAWQFTQAGVNVVAYDPSPVEGGNSKFTVTESYHPVLPEDGTAASAHPDRVLLLCWPDYDQPWAADALASYRGDTVIYVGEPSGGCCADDAFFDLLDAEWDEVDASPHHVTFFGVHCGLSVHRKR